MPSRFFSAFALLLLLVAAAGLWAHATWITTVPPTLEPGQPVTVQIGNGHAFPASESALSTEDWEVFAVTPAGARQPLQPKAAGKVVTASFTPQQAGVYRFVMVRDRGLMSRTPQGLRPGGRDRNPNATQTLKLFRSAVAYAATTGAAAAPAPAPLGLVFEMLPERTATGFRIRVVESSKPVAGAKMFATWPGGKETSIGTTGADGTFTYSVPAGAKGPFLLEASFNGKGPTGEAYDARDYNATLQLVW
jgi:uncharacterized GH25 family protein